jgi:hypothetical protein
MDKKELLNKIKEKKQFSEIKDLDIEKAFFKFEKQDLIESEKIKKTRKVLHEAFGSVLSKKLFSFKILDKKSLKEILKKHVSTSERFEYYLEVYFRILKKYNQEKNLSILDLGCGINGLSYKYFKKVLPETRITYLGIESVGQLVDLNNEFFKKEKIKNFKVIHESLFNFDKIKKEIKTLKKPKIVFLFKIIDALENLEKNYSKKLILNLLKDNFERVVVSFPEKSVSKKQTFKVKRNWFKDFLQEKEINIVDNFVLGGERYLVLGKSS